MTAQTLSKNGKAITEKKTFSRSTEVSIDIQAEAGIIWALLTKASDYPRWNSTVISIEGSIAAGEQIVLQSTLDPKRSFKLKVKEFNPSKQLVWGDAMGTRTYRLESLSSGKTLFTMHERIGGPIFPLFASQIPSFDASFEQFAADLKKEAELISQAK